MSECVIIPPQYAIDSMMYSGYKDAAHAVSELIDNSIQAGENLDRPINVQVICIEKQINGGERCGLNIMHIGVYDNASGMTKDVLQQALQFGGTTRRYATEGMGKFGMGLPNASISQANRVEVYSWQNGECYYTYLDVEEIKNEAYVNVPEPELKEIPKEWKARIEYNADTKIGESGTLVIWSNLERLKWKRHSAFFKHTEFLIGRIYRHFINDGKTTIRLASYTSADKTASEEHFVRPNDPLYLMKDTSAPEEFADKAAFIALEPYTMKLKDENGKEWPVVICGSVATKETREAAHHSRHALSNHAARNMGISLIRAGREIELNQSFISQSDPTERWWGVEVDFQPGLDAVFGITNNKQSAINFKRLTKEEIAAEENTNVPQVMDLLERENNLLKGIVDLTIELDRIIKGLRQTVARTAVAQTQMVVDEGGELPPPPAEKAADDIANDRLAEGKVGESDKKEDQLTEEQKIEELEREIEDKGLTEEEKKLTIIEWLKKDKFILDYADSLTYPSDIVSFSTPAGKIKVSVNTKHPVWQNIISEIQPHLNEETLLKVKDSIMLLFAALARAEDEMADDKKKEAIQDFRGEWGRIARDMFRKYNNE
jgi:anti-sigma regulatory factor (Ser/Thr protein kinase)